MKKLVAIITSLFYSGLVFATSATLPYNLPVYSTPYDATLNNILTPSASHMASGAVPNVDIITAQEYNYLHNSSTAWIYLTQSLGLGQPFNPVGGASLVATPSGGLVSIKDSVSSATQFYVALNNRAVGYTDPSLDSTNWAQVNFPIIAKFSEPYAVAGGTTDAITASYSVPYPVLVDGYRLQVKTVGTNATNNPTFTPTLNGVTQTIHTIYKYSNGVFNSLSVGDIPPLADFRYDATTGRWILFNPQTVNTSSGSFSTTLTGPTTASTDGSANVATTAFVQSATLGNGQTWQNLTASRALGTTYFNTTGRPIVVSVQGPTSANAAFTLSINGISVAIFNPTTGQGLDTGWISGIVPAGASYVATGANSINVWAELR